MPPEPTPQPTPEGGHAGPSQGGPTRRTVLTALSLPVLTPVLATASCGRSRLGTVRGAVQWSGWELAAFQQVLAQFTNVSNYDVQVLSIGSNIDALLGAQVARASVPDVAMLSQPGQVQGHRHRLEPIDPTWAASFPRAWRDLVTIDGAELGIWFKTAHKSMVWYRPEMFERVGIRPPTDYQDWLTAHRALLDAGLAPLAVGAADGWVLSDWFSNVLLGLDPPTYRRLGRNGPDAVDGWRSDPVAEALTLLGQMWVRPGTFPGGVRRALLTQFDESVVDVFTRGQAATVAEGDFVYPVIARYAGSGVSTSWFPFPPPQGHRRPVLVGGDVAVLLRPARPGGRELVSYLASAEAANIWVRQGGFVSVRGDGVPAQQPRQPAEMRIGREARDRKSVV